MMDDATNVRVVDETNKEIFDARASALRNQGYHDRHFQVVVVKKLIDSAQYEEEVRYIGFFTKKSLYGKKENNRGRKQ